MNMDSTETRLRRAAAETREAASHAVPPSLRQERTGGSGWLVLATAFAAVLLVFTIPALLGPGEGEPLGQAPEPTLSSPTTIRAVTTITMTDDTPQQCSAEGTPEPALSSDLPANVDTTARAIIGAASDCDFDGLAGIAAADGSPDLTTSFGGGGIDNLARWEEEGYGEMGTLIRLFGTSHAVTEMQDGPDIYVWPAAFAYDRWEDIPPEYLTELMDLGVYGEGELDEIAKFGSYTGWRIGIDEYGNWLFFVAGD
jgi:hypothetical protein